MRIAFLVVLNLLLTQVAYGQEKLETYDSALDIIKSSKTFDDFTKDERNKNIVVHFEIYSICEQGWFLDSELISKKCEKEYPQVVSENFKLKKLSDRGRSKYIAWISETYDNLMIIQIINKKERSDLATFIFNIKSDKVKLLKEYVMGSGALDK